MVGRGTIIEGSYELDDELARFGHEVLYSGTRISDGAPVDVRIMSADAPQQARRKFGAIAGILSRIDHENCLSALEVGQLVDRSLHTVTPAAMSAPLSSLKGSTVSPRLVIEVGAQLLAGVEHLHTQGIVLGCLTTGGVTIGESERVPRVRIVDFSFARVTTEAGLRPRCKSEEFLAPEIVDGEDADERSDLYSAGVVLRQICTAGQSPIDDPEILSIIDALTAVDPTARPSASAARQRFDQLVEKSETEFDLCWLPVSEPTPVSTGVFTDPISETRESVLAQSTDQNLVQDEDDPSITTADVPAPGGRGRGMAVVLATAAVLAAGVAAYVAFRPAPPLADGAGNAAQTAGGATAVAPAAGSPGQAPAGPANVAAPEPVPSDSASDVPVSAQKEGPEGNPVVWLSQVNRKDLGAVLPFEPRQVLLVELAAREGVSERVNQRWNAMLDLWQAPEARRPCATFAAALASLGDEAKATKEELDLLGRVVVPAPAMGSAAGIAPDESCTGLDDAFEKFLLASSPPALASNTKRKRSRRRATSSAPLPRAEAAPPPAETPKPNKPRSHRPSVAPKLDDGLK